MPSQKKKKKKKRKEEEEEEEEGPSLLDIVGDENVVEDTTRAEPVSTTNPQNEDGKVHQCCIVAW